MNRFTSRVDPVTGRRLGVLSNGPETTPSDDQPEYAELMPKRRPAWRHALHGLALCGCMATNVWLIEQAGWTDFGGRGNVPVAPITGGPRPAREEIELGMSRSAVRLRIGRGDELVMQGRTWEDYPEHHLRLYYVPVWVGGDWDMLVESVVPLP